MDEETKVRRGKYMGDCSECGLMLADYDKELTNGRQCPRCLKQTPDAIGTDAKS